MAHQLKIPWQYVSGHGGPYQQPYLSRQSCEHHSRPLPARDLAKQPHTRAETVASPPGERRVGSGKRSRGAVAVKQETSERGSEGKSGSGAPSSTPHAPRKKRSVLELLPRGEASSLLLLPSTHDLLKKHNYIDPGKLKTVLKESNVVRSEGVRCEGVRAVKGEGERGTKRKEKKKVAVVRKQAWNDDQQKTSDEREKQVKSVQPFRRTVSAAPPDGVPLLDLSKLNEPDHAMKPVVLLSIEEDSENDTTRSCMSWGVPYSRTPDLVRKEKEDETERVREAEEEEMVVEMEGGVSEGGDRQLDVAQAKFVEEKVLSHERAISSLSPHPPQAPPSLRPPGHAPQQALQSHLTFGSGMSESGLTRRLQFEARVLSHNGRDTHRELCGFYFLSDNSITVYEFRKFGKKSSALPLVQRKVYCHQLGHKKGEPYQINYVRRGFTLHFPTSLLPSLPDYMTCHSLLSLRITQCSEREKRQLLCAHRKPTDCISIDSFLHNPLSLTEQQAWAELRTLQSGVRDQIVGRARKALVGLGRYLADHAPSDYSVGKGLIKTAVHVYHIYIDNQELNRFWRILTSLGEFSGEVEVEVGGCEGVRGDRVIAGLVGEMNEERKAIVRKVFQKLDTGKNGNVTLTSIRRFYRHDSSEMEGVWFDHIHKTPLHTAMTTINYADFENFYEGVSIETERDFDFISDLRRCWAL